jgi:putative phosphoesterase
LQRQVAAQKVIRMNLVSGSKSRKLAVLADVHGNLPALQAVLSMLDALLLDGILVAGDMAGGPHTSETIHLLRERNCIMIRGNGENNHLRYEKGLAPQSWWNSRQFALLRWSHRRLSPGLLTFFEQLPEQRVIHLDGTDPIRMVHGSPRDPAEGLSPDEEPQALQAALAQTPEPVLICGHTHIPWRWIYNGKLVFNPGAVCGALNGDVRAQYALLEWREGRWQLEHHAVPYDIERLRRDFEESGLLAEGGHLARAFLLSCETGVDVALGLLQYANRLAKGTGCGDYDVISDEIWEQAGSTFPWDNYEQKR